MALPYPGKVFTPFDELPASDLNEMVANDEALADGTGLADSSVGAHNIDFTTLDEIIVPITAFNEAKNGVGQMITSSYGILLDNQYIKPGYTTKLRLYVMVRKSSGDNVEISIQRIDNSNHILAVITTLKAPHTDGCTEQIGGSYIWGTSSSTQLAIRGPLVSFSDTTTIPLRATIWNHTSTVNNMSILYCAIGISFIKI